MLAKGHTHLKEAGAAGATWLQALLLFPPLMCYGDLSTVSKHAAASI